MIDTQNYKYIISEDVRLILKPVAGKAKAASGLFDNRLFDGTNSLHIKRDPQTNLWSFNYEYGVVPGGLKDKFTSYNKAFEHAEKYFKGRNVEITEVIDRASTN